ncbi:putative lipoprotein [Prevotella sp. MSX73]|nr:hypothetical protein HMPREF0649_00951 [Segatella buccae D17]EJP31709.1 putative lipoprotein [Prevotella sp. MSX73]
MVDRFPCPTVGAVLYACPHARRAYATFKNLKIQKVKY